MARRRGPFEVGDLERHELWMPSSIRRPRSAFRAIPTQRRAPGRHRLLPGEHLGGRRCSTATGILRQAGEAANLTVEVNTLATKIILDGRRATGVPSPARPSSKARSRRPRVAPSIRRMLSSFSGIGRALLQRRDSGSGRSEVARLTTSMRAPSGAATVRSRCDLASWFRQMRIGLQYSCTGRTSALPRATRPRSLAQGGGAQAPGRADLLHQFLDRARAAACCTPSRLHLLVRSSRSSRGLGSTIRFERSAPAAGDPLQLLAPNDRRVIGRWFEDVPTRISFSTRPLAASDVGQGTPAGPSVKSDEEWLGLTVRGNTARRSVHQTST